MAYCYHGLDMYMHAQRMMANEELVNFLVSAAWAELQLFHNLSSFTLTLHDFDDSADFAKALFDHLRPLPLWKTLRSLTIRNSDYCNDWGHRAGLVAISESHYVVQDLVALASQLRTLCLGDDLDLDWLADKLPSTDQLPHLQCLELIVPEVPEMSLCTRSSSITRWMLRFQGQLTNLTLEASSEMYEDQEDIAEELQRLGTTDLAIFPSLQFLKLVPVLRPNCLSNALAIIAPSLQHLELLVPGNRIFSSASPASALPNLLTLSLESRYATMTPLIDHFAAIAHNLVDIRVVSNEPTICESATGAGRLGDSISSSIYPSSRQLTELSLDIPEHLSASAVRGLQALFPPRLNLRVTFTGPPCNSMKDNVCSHCNALSSSMADRRKPRIEQCHSLSAAFKEIENHLDPSFFSSFRVDVVGHGYPADGCEQCAIMEELGVLTIGRRMCSRLWEKD